jgi:NAD(P)-dependent dehydrogenase (short-subunit alcohol dehydrogenase family)
MSRFHGRTCLVTGGGRGIGRATVLRLAREGAAVAVVDLDGDAAHAVVRELAGLGRTGVALAADIAEDAAAERLVQPSGSLAPIEVADQAARGLPA